MGQRKKFYRESPKDPRGTGTGERAARKSAEGIRSRSGVEIAIRAHSAAEKRTRREREGGGFRQGFDAFKRSRDGGRNRADRGAVDGDPRFQADGGRARKTAAPARNAARKSRRAGRGGGRGFGRDFALARGHRRSRQTDRFLPVFGTYGRRQDGACQDAGAFSLRR